jgi:hypothetical protein
MIAFFYIRGIIIEWVPWVKWLIKILHGDPEQSPRTSQEEEIMNSVQTQRPRCEAILADKCLPVLQRPPLRIETPCELPVI